MKDFKEISGAMSSGKTTILLQIKNNYEKSGKIVCFIGENFVQEFGMLASVDKFLKIKSKTFIREYQKMQEFIQFGDEIPELLHELTRFYEIIELKSKPSYAMFPCGWVTFADLSITKISRDLKNVSTHERIAFMMFLCSKVEYDVIIIDNQYALNIWHKVNNMFGNSKIYYSNLIKE